MVTLVVLALLCKGDDILLVRRNQQASFGAGMYSLVGGKVEAGESALKAMRREVHEETGLDIDESHFAFVHAFHRHGNVELLALCFMVDVNTVPDPINKEPEKHDDMQFFNVYALPENILPAHKQAIECIWRKERYSQHGW